MSIHHFQAMHTENRNTYPNKGGKFRRESHERSQTYRV
jgi:hypothetical protein